MSRNRRILNSGATTTTSTSEVSRSQLDPLQAEGEMQSADPDHHTLLAWHQIPPWQQDNEYITRYYRPVTGSIRKCLKSVFAIHNETVNIHSHLIGSLLFFSLPAWTYIVVFQAYSSTNRFDKIVFSTFYLGVAVCFLLSSTFHTINNHSRRVAAFGNQLDYLGIVLLMWGATIPTVYYGFHDDIKLRNLYWSIVSILGGLCCVATMNARFRTPKFRPYRSMMYAALGLSAIVFVVHAIILRGFAEANRRMSLDWMGLMAILNLTGAAAYGIRLPEKLSPGRFDVYGSSHQILHFMVIFAGLAHMFGLLRAFRYYHNTFPANLQNSLV